MCRAQTELQRYPCAARTPITILGSCWKPWKCMLLLWHRKCCTVAYTHIRCEHHVADVRHRCCIAPLLLHIDISTSCDLYEHTFQNLRALCAFASFRTFYNRLFPTLATLATLHYILLIWAARHTIETPFYSNARSLSFGMIFARCYVCTSYFTLFPLAKTKTQKRKKQKVGKRESGKGKQNVEKTPKLTWKVAFVRALTYQHKKMLCSIKKDKVKCKIKVEDTSAQAHTTTCWY